MKRKCKYYKPNSTRSIYYDLLNDIYEIVSF